MFLAIIFIILGLFLLLNAMGIIVGANFWGFFWAVVFLSIGIKMIMRKGRCPMCSGWYSAKMHEKMHEHCDCDHDHDADGEDHH